MNGAWWSLLVLVLLGVALAGAVALVDLLPRRRGDVSDEALRRARNLDGSKQQPSPPAGPFSF